MTDANGLSEVQRYWKSRDELVENECGAWVRYDDYAAMAARLKAFVACAELNVETLKTMHANVDAERLQKINELNDAVDQLTAEQDTYKKLWSLRGEALKRPCLKCGYMQCEIVAQAALTDPTQRGGFAAGQQE